MSIPVVDLFPRHVAIDEGFVEQPDPCTCGAVRGLGDRILGRVIVKGCPAHGAFDYRPSCYTCSRQAGGLRRVESVIVIRDLATNRYTMVAHCHGATMTEEIAQDADEYWLENRTLVMKHA